MLWLSLKLATGCEGTSMRGLAAGQVQLQPVPCLRPPSLSHKVISRRLLPMVDMEVPQEAKPNRLAAASARLRAAQPEVWDMLKPDAACLVFVNL